MTKVVRISKCIREYDMVNSGECKKVMILQINIITYLSSITFLYRNES